ncbi:MAG: sterol desaturase family protein [Bryobacteraceae bacterium]|nr:sterol desaturase family protein [Bryobacteraceae bacterium]MDW8379632.1 sterol desaturase family protein [Bryobacterales bacterium]
MVYPVWLAGFALLFWIAERVRPWRKQKLFRAGLLQDVFYIVFNAHFFGMLVGIATAGWLRSFPSYAPVALHLMEAKPFWLQLVVLFVVFDFLKYCIHNLLHRVPWLWRFHKVHHSVVEMDWIGNWRYHWVEQVVYDSLLYVPLAFLGFSQQAMFWNGVLATFFGHYAHANVRLGLGPLRYVFNSPQMHIWHHAHPDCGPTNKNFGISLSLWDWIFGTAYLPSQQPPKLGFAGIEQYPQNFFQQMIAPWRRFGH